MKTLYVDVAYQNHCVECEMSYIGRGIVTTYTIPSTPVPADAIGALSHAVGVSLNGIELAAPAPVADILGNYTIAAFDDCGGHVNLNQGYHYRAATGCTETGVQADGHAAMLGYALDGCAIYGLEDAEGQEPVDLDECRGHSDALRGYHDHAASAGENLFIGCFRGKTVQSARCHAAATMISSTPFSGLSVRRACVLPVRLLRSLSLARDG